ncbi:GIY-YIG nuclease family protein [Afifella pfennigii]|uniref:GIY-YIG nuclease family protein n=1 Tax=Afifella pfennigii TaxID=209897 RepID=UPI00146FB849|nr:GIY-YIG nuclease family protein [Afifella pfennigii]
MAALLAEYRALLERLPPLLEELQRCTPHPLTERRHFPAAPGVYVIFEGAKPLYTGRSKNIRQRIGNHIAGRAEQSAFAFRLAREATGHLKASYKPLGSRKHLMANEEFRAAFERTTARLRAMSGRYVVIDDLLSQHLFEVYAATALKTPYNDFATH